MLFCCLYEQLPCFAFTACADCAACCQIVVLGLPRPAAVLLQYSRVRQVQPAATGRVLQNEAVAAAASRWRVWRCAAAVQAALLQPGQCRRQLAHAVVAAAAGVLMLQ